MKIKLFIIVIAFLLSFVSVTNAQNIQKISTRCPSPNNSLYSTLTMQRNGNIDAVPCPSGTFNINGVPIPNPASTITGTGTATRFPIFTAATTIGNSPYSWNGTAYVWDNTAENSVFNMTLTPSDTTGNFTVGDTSNDTVFFNLGGLAATADLKGNLIVIGDTNSLGNDTLITLNDGSQALTFRGISTFQNNAVGQVPLTVNAVAGQTQNLANFSVNGTVQARINNSGGYFFGTSGNAGIYTSSGSVLIAAGGGSLIYWTGSSLRTDASNTFDLGSNTIAWRNLYLGSGINYTRTITPPATTGAQVINQPAGTVNFAAAATSLVVTNSLVTANSIINVQARTNDSTCSVKNYVAAAGSFTINMTAACTAETSVGFIVTN